MNDEEKIKMFNDVFAPREWYKIFEEMGKDTDFNVDWMEYKATGLNNAPVPEDVLNTVKKSNLVLAMTEFSGTSSILPICRAKGSTTRGASMPRVERRMENSAFKANYKDVKRYAQAISKLLNKAIGAEVLFSTDDTLFIDLRNRKGHADTGDCTEYGMGINFPSGEACTTAYEATLDEIKEFGESKTKGIWPAEYDGELVRYVVENNRIVDVIGEGKQADEKRAFFEENDTRRNLAELGIGCNPEAVVTGNVLEDEKVGGLHIAYGMSAHLGGKVKSDVHQDICYPKDAPIQAKTLTLINENGSKTEVIRDARLQYEIFD
jgi:leucyl aminopeptidase (aminopeptidase T)